VGNAFQEQLLKAGLVDDKKIKQAKKEQYRAQKQGKQKAATQESRRAAQRAQAEQAERDRELNRRRQKEQAQKAVAAQVRQLIESHRLSREGGDVPYNFSDNGPVKRIYVTEEQHAQISRGRLAIVRLGEGYELVPAAAAEKIHERDAASVVLLCAPSAASEAEDDPYAEFKVPDDLMW
jgi:uncharacterized protein YaiL (DUF2058 family)